MKILHPPTVKKSVRKTAFTKDSPSIVAIGASAGGLDAVRQLLKDMHPDIGMVFFYVQHLSPTHPSSLASILSQDIKMKVHEAANMMHVEPGNLYVCTPNKEMRVANGQIRLTPRDDSHLPYLPIDDFFVALAKEYKQKVTGIILSGNAADGTQGLKAIKEAGGLPLPRITARNTAVCRHRQ
jgi:two-component system, chemotaxis family, CheB/CheR fusion protein